MRLRLLAWFLNRALARACPEQHGFFVPTAWAQACLKDRLLTEVPTLAIRNLMFDWLQVGGQTLHASDYFIGGGGWSVFLRSIEKSAIVHEAVQLIEKDMAWGETQLISERSREKGRRPLDAVLDLVLDLVAGVG